MRALTSVVLAAALAGVAGCAGSPVQPTAPSPAAAVAVDAAVDSVAADIVAQAALVSPTVSPFVYPMTVACPNGGSRTISVVSTLPVPPVTTYSMVLRTEYRDCAMGGSVVNGDPYLQTASEYTITALPGAAPAGYTSTTRTTGALRFTVNGALSRVAFACTTLMTITLPADGTAPLIARQTSGTITTTPPAGPAIVRPCGPA